VALFLEELDKQGLVVSGNVWNTFRTRKWKTYTWTGPRGQKIDKAELEAIVDAGVEFSAETKRTANFVLGLMGDKPVFRYMLEKNVKDGIGPSAAMRIDASITLLVEKGIIVEEYPDEFRRAGKSDGEIKKILEAWEFKLSVPENDREKQDRIILSGLQPDVREAVEFIMGKFGGMVYAESALKVYHREVEIRGPEWRKKWESYR
jgi:hypothetical protein